jgi:[acyl-carrier-protein] S-malonyltransferase
MINIALIFPGQGAQTVGMGKEFYDSNAQAKSIFDKANQIIPGLTDVIFNGPPEKLTSTAFCQPAIFTFSYAAFKAFSLHPKYKNVKPLFAGGLSLGELTAVAASEALSFEEALKVVERRATFMEEATKMTQGKMAAILGFDKQKIIDICQRAGAEVANFNSPDQIVITGEAAKVERAGEEIKAQGAKRVIFLDVSGAFHSSLMAPAVPKFKLELDKFQFKTPHFKVLSNVDALPTDSPEHIKGNLSKQITSSVQWVNTVLNISKNGVQDFVEIGPGNVLKGLIRKIDPNLRVHNIAKPDDIDALPF